MGNVCVSREETREEDFELHRKYRKLQDEVCATLADRQRFTVECGQSYRAACESRCVKILNKPLMTEMTRHFLQKLACDDDPRMVTKIYYLLERQFPNEDEAIMEAAFRDFIQDVLIQIDMDIREKLRRLEAKHPGFLRDDTLVQHNEHEQLDSNCREAAAPRFTEDTPISSRLLPPQGHHAYTGGTDAQLATTEDLMRQRYEFQKQRYDAEVEQLERQRQQQEVMNKNEMDITYDMDGPRDRTSVGQPPLAAQRTLPPGYMPQPPKTQPQPAQKVQLRQAVQPPLSAAQLQQHQNSYDQNRSMQETALQRLREQEEPTMVQAPIVTLPLGRGPMVSPPPTPDPMATAPFITQQQPYSADNYQASLMPAIPSTTAPPPTVSLPVAAPLPELSQEDVESMMDQIMSATDGLKVQVYNQFLQLEPKRLSLNRQLGKIGIFDVMEGGLGYPTAFFDIPDLKCITQGISQSIMENPPHPDLALGFRFSQEDSATKDRSQDKFLCFVFDSPHKCRLAGEAFSQLCGVPVAPAV